MRKALLIVDVQNDFCPGGSLAVPNGDEIIDPINELVSYANQEEWELLASRDWHPEDTRHFEQWPVHCVQGTDGATFHPKVDLSQAKIVNKGMGKDEDAYSVFDGELDGGISLQIYLEKKGISNLVIAGLATDYCVKATALDAIKKSFEVSVVKEACRAVDVNDGDGEKAFGRMSENGVILVSLEEILK